MAVDENPPCTDTERTQLTSIAGIEELLQEAIRIATALGPHLRNTGVSWDRRSSKNSTSNGIKS
jgi:NADH:ubiquinone oxidoreductase subunit D